MSIDPAVRYQRIQQTQSSRIYDVADYLAGRSDVDRTLAKLRTSSPAGQLMSGEICLEEASRDEENANFWVKKSVSHFGNAWRPEDLATFTANTPTAANAALRLAQMPVLRPLLIEKEFATSVRVEEALRDTVTLAGQLGSILLKTNKYRNTQLKNACVGILGEYSVLGLAERFSLRNGLTDCWQASISLLGSDRGTVLKGDVKDGWDIDVWSKVGDSPPESVHHVQVKSSDRILKFYRGVQVVHVSPDLAAHGDTPGMTGYRIIHELQIEDRYANPNNRLSKRLDARTEQFLAALER